MSREHANLVNQLIQVQEIIKDTCPSYVNPFEKSDVCTQLFKLREQLRNQIDDYRRRQSWDDEDDWA
jgi:DNA gyrase/topoisomerase IV subunit B